MHMNYDDKKLLSIGSIAKKSKITDWKIRDWFFGQRDLSRKELNAVIPALEEAETRARNLKQRAENELQKKIGKE
jgi:hypothetical protein